MPPLPGYEPPDDKDRLPTKTESPAEKLETLKEEYPALIDADTALQGFPDQRDEILQVLILESRGGPDVRCKNNYILDRILKRLKEMGIPRDHVGGGITKEAGYQKEHYFKPKKGIRARRSDGRIEVEPAPEEKFLEDFQTVDTYADGKTLTKKENLALVDIIAHKLNDKEKGDVSTYPKHPGMPLEEWERLTGEAIDEWVEAKFGRYRGE